MADGFWRVPVSAEVDAFDREVGGDQGIQLLARRFRKTENGAVVAYAGDDGFALRAGPRRTAGCCQLADLGDERFLGQRHSLTLYSRSGVRAKGAPLGFLRSDAVR